MVRGGRMTAHTKGPWLIDAESPCTITARDGSAIADCDLVYSRLSNAERKANARLVSIAPDMFELLQRSLNSGAFDARPVFRGDVIKLLKSIEGK